MGVADLIINGTLKKKKEEEYSIADSIINGTYTPQKQEIQQVQPTIQSVQPTINDINTVSDNIISQKENNKNKLENEEQTKKQTFSFSIDNKEKTEKQTKKEYDDAYSKLEAYQKEKGINLFNRDNKKNKNDKEYQRLLKDVQEKQQLYNDSKVKKNTEKLKEDLEKANPIASAVARTGLAFGSGATRGFEGIESSVRKLTGQEQETQKYNYNEPMLNAAQEGASKGEQVAMNIAQSWGQMTPQMLAPGSKTAMALGFANYGGSAYNDAKKDGATEEQATMYGIASGSTEMLMEKLLGGFENIYGKKLGKDFTGNVMSKLIKNKAVRDTLSGMKGEFTEEYLQEFLEPILKNIILKEDNGADFWNTMKDDIGAGIKQLSNQLFNKQNLVAGLYGAASSGLLQGPMNFANQSRINQMQQNAPQMQQNVPQMEQQIQQPTEMPTQTPLSEVNQGVLQENNQLMQPTQTPQITPLNQVNQELQETRQNDIANQVQALNLEQQPTFTQKQGNYVYEKSDNSKIDNLRKDAANYLKEGEQTTNFINTLEKLVNDKDIEIRFDPKLGNNVNGTYKNGVITINPNSNRAGEFVAIHELTHAIGTKPMIDMIQTYRKSNAEFNNAVERLLSTYNTTEINEEALGDIAGQLFGNQEYINNLSMENPSLFKRIYNEIKYLWHQFRGYKNQDQFIEDLRNKWESAYRNSQAKQTNKIGYSINGDGRDFFYRGQQKEGTDLSYNDTQFQGSEDDGYYFTPNKKTANKYGKNIIERFRDENNTVTVEESDRLQEMAEKKLEEHMKEGKWFEEDDLLEQMALGRSKAFAEYTGKPFVETGDMFGEDAEAVYYPEFDKDTKYSIEEVKEEPIKDNTGKELSKQQQEYFKDSKAVDDKGELEVVYHGSKKAGFTTFETPDNVSFFTDNEGVANTYSGSNEKVDTKKLESLFDAKTWLKGINEDLYIENNKVYDYDGEEILSFDNQEDLLKNLKRAIQIELGNTEAGGVYEGYVNITKPYTIDVEGQNWNNITIGENKEIKNMYDSLSEKEKDSLSTLADKMDSMYDNYKDGVEGFYQRLNATNEKLYDKVTNDNSIREKLYKAALYQWEDSSVEDLIGKRYSTNDIVKQVLEKNKNGSNYDGVIFKNIIDEGMYEGGTDGSPSTVYVTLNPNQFKAANNLNPTNDPDIRYSKDNQTWREYLEKEFPSQGTRTNLQDINERNKPLNKKEKTELDGLKALADTGWVELSKEESTRLKELERRNNIKDTTKALNLEKETKPKYSINENAKNDYVTMKVDKAIQKNAYKNVNKATKTAENYLKFDREQKANFKDSIKKLSLKTKEQLVNSKTYNQVKDIVNNFANVEYNFIDEELKSIKKEIRNTKINIPAEIREQITDYSDFRKQSKLNISKDGQNIDSIWQELSEEYPHIFSSDIQTEADMLYALSDLMNKDVKITEKYRIPDSDLKYATDKIYNSLLSNSITQAELDSIQEDLSIKAARRTRQVVQNELLKQMGITLEDIETGKDISAVRSQLLDPRRLNEEVFSPKVAKKINDATVNFVSEQEANSNRFKNKERQEIKDLGIKARSKESAAVQKYGEKEWINDKGELLKYGDEELARDFPNVETQEKIKNAAKVLRNKYDNYIDKINASLEEMGYDPIPKRKDYFKHFFEISDKLSQWGVPFNANSMNEDLLPTDINGLTDEFKPGKNWFASAQQRTGKKTIYDAITGIDQYLEGASNLIFHTESIQRYRTLSKFIRDTYGQVNGLNNAANLSEAQIQKRIEDIQSNKLSRYAAWLDEQANAMAGKKGKIDRGIEEFFGRRVYSALNTLKSQVGSNMTGFNVRSAMTNFASAIQGASKIKKTAFLKGTLSTLQNMVNNDGLIDKSNFLTNRFGSDSISKKAWQKVANAGQIFMTGTDYFTANQIWRSKYFENMSKGMTEKQAIKNADDFAARIMGDRSKGQTAAAFNSKTLGFLTQFQLEVNNQWQSMIHDNKMDVKTGNKSGAAVLFQLGQLFAMSNLFNTMMKGLTGSDVMFDPIDILKGVLKPDDDDKEKDMSTRMREALGKIVDQLPMASVFTGGRIPIGEAFKGVSTGAKYLTGGTNKWGQPLTTKDVKKDMLEALPYWILPTGWGQIRKTKQGLSMYSKDKPVAGSYTDSGNLRFTADTSLGGKTKSALFGQYSSKEAQDYIKGGFKTITKGNNIDELKNLGYTSSQYKKYRQELNAAGRKNQEKIDYIMGLDIPKKEKDVMASRVLRKPVNTNDIKKFDTLIEFNKWYKKNNSN